ncbi:MAG: LPS export ABC transporter permease LptF [Bdellovibrionaceae bacterium]|nr:LPS export ABC transporter permease LptF [Pseudobdellovibrionaceae bacterium]
MEIFRSRLVMRYLLGEMIPTFFLGVVVFVFILLTFQALRLTEFVLVHGIKVSVVAQMMAYLSTSFLPVLFPMSLLFTILMTYGRLSADSEIIALKAAGLGMVHIIAPAFVLSLLIALLSAQTAFHIAPWGNRQFELLVTKHGSMKPGVALKEGTFSEGFFDLVVYANRIDSKRGLLEQVFIYDESDSKSPLTVIAREGRLVLNPDNPGHEAQLQLSDGDIHRTSDAGRHTKIHFATYTINLQNPVTEAFRDKSPPSFSLEELQAQLRDTAIDPILRRRLVTEFHKRLAISSACILFALIGVGLGTTTNRRAAKSGGMVLSVGLIVTYWILYVTAENMAKQGKLPPGLAMWIPNVLFMIASVFSLRRAWS